MNRYRICLTPLVVSILIISSATIAFCQPEKTFQTKYADIHYSDDKDLEGFIWRLGGGPRAEVLSDKALASSRVDRIVSRVEAILDMWPGSLKLEIYLHRGLLESGRVAEYVHRDKSIHISVDNVNDGIFAHEVAHAIINKNFGAMLPSKMQEILTQYVDKYLWNDYY